MAEMQDEKAENKVIAEQAVNFDKLPWNRKERNFALFWPTVGLIMFAVTFLNVLFEGRTLDNGFWIVSILVLSLCTPLLYYAYKDYLWALVAIPALSIIVGFYQYWATGKIYWMAILGTMFFIIPIKVELYRRTYGLSKPKNIKKDIIIGISSGLFFPIIFFLVQLVRNMLK